MNVIDARRRIGLGLVAVGVVGTAALMATTPRAHAAPSDPASCNSLVTKYFKSSKPTGSTVDFTLVSDNNGRTARYIEGDLALKTPTGLFQPTSLTGTGKRYTSTERHTVYAQNVPPDEPNFGTDHPFDPAKRKTVNVSVSYAVLPANDRQLMFSVDGAAVTPAGCMSDNVLYGTRTSWGYSEAVIISLGPLTDPVPPPQ
jgi:hypothetical protein